MQSLGKPYRSILRNAIVLPDDSFCPTCTLADLESDAVRRVMAEGRYTPEELDRVSCKCAKDEWSATNAERERLDNANFPQHDNGIGPRTFSNFNMRDGAKAAFDAARAFIPEVNEAGQIISKDPPILVMLGVTGCGKSHLLEAIGREYHALRLTVRYELVSDLLIRLRHTFNNDTDQDLFDLMEWYKNRRLLILDDLGQQSVTDWGTEQLVNLIDDRYRDGWRLVVATNKTKADMEATDARMASRLYDSSTGTVQVVRMKCGDYRSRKQKGA